MRNRAKSSARRQTRFAAIGAALALAASLAASSVSAQGLFGAPEERAQRRAERQAERERRQAERQAEREARQAEWEARRSKWAARTSTAIAIAPDFPPEAARYMAPGPRAVASWTEEWTDAKRGGRVVPVRIYMPTGETGPLPVILVSHGLGGSRDGLAYLGNHYASHGFVAAHMQHAGSDTAVFRQALGSGNLKTGLAGAITPQSFLDRSGDPPFVLDELARQNAAPEGKLAGRLDLRRVGIAGHSYGAGTSLTMAGQGFGPTGATFADARVKAAAPLSPPPPRRRSGAASSYGSVAIPVFIMTGTLDDSPVDGTPASERRVAFDNVSGIDAYLVTLAGGDHMCFSGERRPGAYWSKGDPANDAAFHPLILSGTLAFFEAYLNGDADAKAWLSGGGYEAALGKWGVFEKKSAGDSPKKAVEAEADKGAASGSDTGPRRRGLLRRR